MDNIFLDTSIFIKENFLEGAKIKQFLSLGEKGYIQIISTPITKEEIKNVFQKWIKTTDHLFRAFKKNVEVKALKNTIAGKSMLIYLNSADMVDEFNINLEIAFTTANFFLLDYDAIDLKDLFDKYFTNSYPFNTGDKKMNFPTR